MVDRTLARRSCHAAGLGVAALMALLLTPPAPAWSWQEPVALETLEVTATLQKDAAQQRVQQAQRNLAQDMADVLRDEPAIQIGGGSRNASAFICAALRPATSTSALMAPARAAICFSIAAPPAALMPICSRASVSRPCRHRIRAAGLWVAAFCSKPSMPRIC